MKSKNVKGVFIFLALAVLIIISQVYAAEFPVESGQELQESWIINNADDFDPQDDAQRGAFREAYKNGRINLNENPEIVEKYLLDYEEGILKEDRGILNDFISEKTGGINTNLEKGSNIALEKNGGEFFIVSGDGQRHGISELSSLEGLDGISSNEDGTLVLNFGDDSINLKDTTVNFDNFGNLRLADGTSIKLNDNFGNLVIDGSKGISCESDACALGLRGMDIGLNSGGQFQHLGNNRYSIVDGTANLGNGIITGSSEFSTDVIGKNVNFDKKVNLRSFFRDGHESLQESSIKVDNERFGKVEIFSGSGTETVLGSQFVGGLEAPTGLETNLRTVACLECSDFRKDLENYDGYVEIKDVQGEGIFNAEIKGITGANFGDDAKHLGKDRNLLLSYDNSNPDQGMFRLKGCEGCEEGNVGSQVLNGFNFDINNEIEGDKQKLNVEWLDRWSGRQISEDLKEDFERSFYIVDETSETANMYLINNNPSNPALLMETIDQEVVDEYVEYNSLVNKIGSEVENFCGRLSESECGNLREFAGNMREGNDGGIHSIVSGRCGEGHILFNQGRRCMMVDNQNIKDLISQGKISEDELIALGRTNLEIESYETIEGLKTVTRSLYPQTGEELVFNAATGGLGEGTLVLSRARSATKAASAGANLGLKPGVRGSIYDILNRGRAVPEPELPDVFLKFQGIRKGTGDFKERAFGVYDAATRKNIGEFSYEISGDTMRVGKIDISPKERGKRYSTAAFDRILSENPRIRRIETQLAEVNRDVFRNKLQERLGSRKYSELSSAERDDLVESAIKETPAYRARLRNGFETICDKNFDPVIEFVSFSVCR